MSSIDLIAKIIGFIEDSGLVNAGVGSHLNINKQVEMDASLLSSKGITKSILQASVTGVNCINNPIKICKEMINLQELQFKSLIKNEMHAPNKNEMECVIATSSGGPWLKEAGRIGSACIRGTGFDIKCSNKNQEIYMALCSEHNLMKKLAARPLIWD
eukprot:403347445